MAFQILIENDMNLYLNDFSLEEDGEPITDAELVVHIGHRFEPVPEITHATNATPIVITSPAHGRANGERVIVSQVRGNDAANGLWTISSVTADTFALVGSVGDGDFVPSLNGLAAGVWYLAIDGAVEIELENVGGERNAYLGRLSRDNSITANEPLGMVIECPNYGVKFETQGVSRVRT